MRLIDAVALKEDMINLHVVMGRSEYDELDKWIDFAPTIPQWTKINSSEDLPPPNTPCVKYYMQGANTGYDIGFTDYNGTWHGNGDFRGWVFTHWIHLPEPPKEGE